MPTILIYSLKLLQKFNETIEYIKKKSGISIYNFLKDPTKKAPGFESYITRPDVRELIHVGNSSFHYNNQHVYYKMLGDFANTTKPFVEELLENYGVMSYRYVCIPDRCVQV